MGWPLQPQDEDFSMSGEFRGIAVASLAAATLVSANANRAAFDLLNYDGDLRLVLDSTATDGSGETLDVKIQHSDDGSTGWADSGVAFAQVTNAAASYQVVAAKAEQFKRYIRVVDTVAGTSPTASRAVSLIGKLRRV